MNKEYIEFSDELSVLHATLDNGLTVYLMETPKQKNCYAIYGTKYGSTDIAFSKNNESTITVPDGIAHFLEHKLFENEDGDAFSKFAVTGASANAYTSFDRTCYLFQCTNNFEKNLEILLDFVQNPYFTKETIQKELGIIGQEIKMYDDSPFWCSLFNMLKCMYPNHPVNKDIAGTVESIAKITPELLYSCYETFYNPSNMYLCAAGNFNSEEILQKITREINTNAPVTITREPFIDNAEVTKHYIKQEMDMILPVFVLGYKQKINSPTRSLKTQICMNILSEIICGSASPLNARLIKEGLISSPISCEYFTGYGYATLMFSGESENPNAVTNAIKEEINRLKQEGIDKKIFSAEKCAMYGSFIRSFDSQDSIVSNMVDCAINDVEFFEDIKILKNLTTQSLEKRLNVLDNNNTVLSVILPIDK